MPEVWRHATPALLFSCHVDCRVYFLHLLGSSHGAGEAEKVKVPIEKLRQSCIFSRTHQKTHLGRALHSRRNNRAGGRLRSHCSSSSPCPRSWRHQNIISTAREKQLCLLLKAHNLALPFNFLFLIISCVFARQCCIAHSSAGCMILCSSHHYIKLWILEDLES